jgi:hypothetical protein
MGIITSLTTLKIATTLDILLYFWKVTPPPRESSRRPSGAKPEGGGGGWYVAEKRLFKWKVEGGYEREKEMWAGEGGGQGAGKCEM